MYLIAGLGNIGAQYNLTRHNIGFEAADYFAQAHNLRFDKHKFKGSYASGVVCGQKVLVVKPETYMNLSGECIAPLADYYDIPHENIIVIHDDIEFEPGAIRIRKAGSGGTHNGMKNVVMLLGSDVARIRIGVGNNPQMELYSYVLSRFLPEEVPVMREAVLKTNSILEEYLLSGIDSAMNKYNVRRAKKKKDEKEGSDDENPAV